MIKEFKEFAMRGSVIDLAIGIIIGGAFGKIVTSFVNDILMPPIGMLTGKIDFSSLFVSLNGQSYASIKAAKDAGAATINYGLFISNVIDFVFVAFAVFLLVRQINRLKREEPVAAAEPDTKECAFCASAIPAKATRCPLCTSQLEESV